ncbi:MAG TPA: hypothetical protein VF185_01135 [Patescibacteria group bacterium]
MNNERKIYPLSLYLNVWAKSLSVEKNPTDENWQDYGKAVEMLKKYESIEPDQQFIAKLHEELDQLIENYSAVEDLSR